MPFTNTSPFQLGMGTDPYGGAGGFGQLIGAGVALAQAIRNPSGIPAWQRRLLRRGYTEQTYPGGSQLPPTVPADLQLNLGGPEGITLGSTNCEAMFTPTCGGAGPMRARNTVHANNPSTGKTEVYKRVIPTGWRIAGKRRCRPRCRPR